MCTLLKAGLPSPGGNLVPECSRQVVTLSVLWRLEVTSRARIVKVAKQSRMYHKILIFFILAALITLSKTQVAEKLIDNACQSRTSCRQCIRSPGCSWCLDEKIFAGTSRCDIASTLLKRNCRQNYIFNPKSAMTTVKAIPVSSNDTKDVVQISPQEIKLKLRAGEASVFNVTFYQSPNYPVDLYYLMDLTFSMKEHKERVAELADLLAASMHNITKNFRLGFGSFIDKVVMPYADMEPSRIKNPCRDYVCVPAYGFKNHLALDPDTTKFTDEVDKAQLSGNLDNAEGGFDAIMQAIVCKEHVKWDLFSRKILIFATDSIFHYAGDGKLGGIVKPNDGLCHLDTSGFYTQSIHQDYPSLSQLSNKAKSHGMNIIFAVPEERFELYDTLRTFIEGSYTRKLSEDSSNIVDLIKDQYELINSEVVLSDDAKSPVLVKYSSRCLGKTKEFQNSCSNLKIGDSVTFEVKVEVTNCPEDPKDWKKTVLISPVGLTESVKLDLELMCGCDCENHTAEEKKSEKCSRNGTYSCGTCKCDTNHFGSQCQCAGDNVIRDDMLELCKRQDSGEICSGKGDCVCGKCDCYSRPRDSEKIYGDYCECDTFSCERDSKGEICGGPEQGRCCGKCLCESGWTGAACDCTTDTSGCIDPLGGPGELCSGRGSCQCGQCRCRKDEKERYGGLYCEDSTSGEGLCTGFRSCCQCQVFGTGPLSKEECDECPFQASVVDTLLVESPDERVCIFKDDDDCIFQFQYSYDSENLPVVRVKREKECPTEVEIVWIIIGVVAGVLAIGIVAVLIAKLVIHYKDLRDYKAFMDEVSQAKFAEVNNPIFKAAVSKFENPMFMPSTATGFQ